MGVSPTMIQQWVERGMANPETEPYASFSVDYRRAERGIEVAISETEAYRVQQLREQQRSYMLWLDRGPAPPEPREPPGLGEDATDYDREEWQAQRVVYERKFDRWQADMLAWSTPPPCPDVRDMEWMGRLKERRFPEDTGASAHRKPEPEHSASNWLDANQMDLEQLKALFDDAPEVVVDALHATGWVRMLEPNKVTDEG